jgi:hypothetical protein
MKNDVFNNLCILVSSIWDKQSGLSRELISSGDTDWDQLFREATRERIAGLLCYILEKNGAGEKLPQEILNKFRSEYDSILYRNMFRKDLIEEALSSLEKAGIPSLAIKGVYLLKEIYPSPGTRYHDDVDLVFPQANDMISAGKILKDKGYRASPLYPDTFYRENMIKFDLHGSIMGVRRMKSRELAYKMRTDEYYSRALPWKYDWDHVRKPSPEDHILILSYHAEKHSYEQMRYFTDIAMLLHREQAQIDLNNVLLKAKEQNLERPLFICLEYLQKNLNFPLPGGLTECLLGVIKPGRLERKMDRRILYGRPVPRSGCLLPVFSIKKWTSKIRFLAETCLPSGEALSQTTGIKNPFLNWLNYPLRLFQIVTLAVRTLFAVYFSRSSKGRT